MKSLLLSFFLALSASSRCYSGNDAFAVAFHPVAQGIAGVTSAAASASASTRRRLLKHHDRNNSMNSNDSTLRTFLLRQRVKCFALSNQITEHNNDLNSKKSTSSVLSNPHRQVAILLPEPPNIESESNNDDDAQWHLEAMNQLENISNHLGLPIHDNIWDNEPAAPIQYSHHLTAVPYPRTNSYALAIHHTNPSPSSNNRRNQNSKKRKKMKLDSLFVDLCPPTDTQLGYRMNKNSIDGGGGELLLKALGVKKMLAEKNHGNEQPLVIYDLTAGMARDSLVILSSVLANYDLESSQYDTMPFRLHMVERDPIVAMLLSDAMRRLGLLAAVPAASASSSDQVADHHESNTARQLTHCLSMEEGDGVSVLNRLMSTSISNGSTPPSMASSEVPCPPDVVFLDPMFPPRKKKSSAVKKDMAMLHSLLGTAGTNPNNNHAEDDVISASPSSSSSPILQAEKVRVEEEQALLLAAYTFATRRVVVKRPIGAQPLGLPSEKYEDDDIGSVGSVDVPKPSYDVRGSVNRFDVYNIIS